MLKIEWNEKLCCQRDFFFTSAQAIFRSSHIQLSDDEDICWTLSSLEASTLFWRVVDWMKSYFTVGASVEIVSAQNAICRLSAQMDIDQAGGVS